MQCRDVVLNSPHTRKPATGIHKVLYVRLGGDRFHAIGVFATSVDNEHD